jgi:hypothetical protein
MYMKDNEEEVAWTIEVGLYPGLLLGFRSYQEVDRNIHVLYLPLIDIAFTKYK